ncbi:hypothetical protein NDU88_009582 [Pleurodeles waltl]|uniref:Uncharacterized protein n=1 Tax=Pleurodeles waltl TaxID=8319 RepID=A0AAV7PSL9_PLEWA|nr:hypothetical protein NDU88_009582 [Pleurodeles waltl]
MLERLETRAEAFMMTAVAKESAAAETEARAPCATGCSEQVPHRRQVGESIPRRQCCVVVRDAWQHVIITVLRIYQHGLGPTVVVFMLLRSVLLTTSIVLSPFIT